MRQAYFDGVMMIKRAERRRKGRGHEIAGWIRHPSPKDLKEGTGWFSELDRVYRRQDSQIVCMIRDLQTEWGKVSHVTITAHKQPNWAEKQQIKNELFGEEATAIEVFPKESELVNNASMYHIWILHNISIPFGID